MEKRKNYKHALIVGKFAPLHKGHQWLIDTALSESDHVTILVYSNPDFPEMPQSKRAAWVKEIYPQINVLCPTQPPLNIAEEYTHREFVKKILSTHHIKVDTVFTSEAYGEDFAEYLGIKHRLVDLERKTIPISGTKIRNNHYEHRSFLHPIVYQSLVRKIVLMGAESTGKSTLAAALAKHFSTAFVPEYGREYYEKKKGVLNLQDYVHIAKQHRHIEDTLVNDANQLLFVDTNAITTLFFSYYYNGSALPELHALADECKARYDHYFVCSDDIAFEQDGWRDTELLRSKMQRMILRDLNNRKIPHTILTGTIQDRVEQACLYLQNAIGSETKPGIA